MTKRTFEEIFSFGQVEKTKLLNGTESEPEGKVEFDDYRLLEYVQALVREEEMCVGLLGTGFDLAKRPIRLVLTLEKEYVTRSVRIDWSSEYVLGRWWNETDRKAFVGVYYSVLGGAFCSLGKENKRYAHKAGELAVKQIQLAKELKDPVLESKCWLYFAEDLIQLNQLKKVNRILNRQRILIHRLQNTILFAMLCSVEAKLNTVLQTV